MSITRTIATVGCGLWLLSACSPTRSPDVVARTFVDHLFVEGDQQATVPLTEGLARVKVEEELRLLAQQPPSRDDERPRIFYRELRREIEDDSMTFYYRLTVLVIGDQPHEPELIVHVRPTNDAWHVSNYNVLPPRDEPAAAVPG